MNSTFVHGYQTEQKFVRIAIEHREIHTKRSHTIMFVVNCEQARHPFPGSFLMPKSSFKNNPFSVFHTQIEYRKLHLLLFFLLMVAMVFFKLKEEGFQKFTYSLTQPRSQIQQEGKAVVKIFSRGGY